MNQNGRFCLSCLMKGVKTLIGEGDCKSGGYYWCRECKGAVLTITRNGNKSKLLVEIEAMASVEEISAKIKGLATDMNIRQNRDPHILELDSPWMVYGIQDIIAKLSGVKKITVITAQL